MPADEHPTQARTTGGRDRAQEPVPDRKATLGGGAAATQDPADAAAGIPE